MTESPTLDEIESAMGQALAEGRSDVFVRLADERMARFVDLCKEGSDRAGVDRRLQRSINLSRQWMELAQSEAAGRERMIDQVRIRRNGLRQLARAYKGSASKEALFAHAC